MQALPRVKKVKKTTKKTPKTQRTAEMPDISSTGISKNKMWMLNCSSSTRPGTESVPESFILYDSGHLPKVTNLGNKSDAQLYPLASQSRHLSDRQTGRGQIPYRNRTLSLGAGHPLPWPSAKKQGTHWFSGHYLSRALGTVVIRMTGEVEKGNTKLFLRSMYTVISVLKIESIHTTHFI